MFDFDANNFDDNNTVDVDLLGFSLDRDSVLDEVEEFDRFIPLEDWLAKNKENE